jgi:hypothetical protein
MREQPTIRVSYEWTAILVFIFPAFDRTLASRAGEVVQRQRRKSFRLQADASESSCSVAICGHQISCDARCSSAFSVGSKLKSHAAPTKPLRLSRGQVWCTHGAELFPFRIFIVSRGNSLIGNSGLHLNRRLLAFVHNPHQIVLEWQASR